MSYAMNGNYTRWRFMRLRSLKFQDRLHVIIFYPSSLRDRGLTLR